MIAGPDSRVNRLPGPPVTAHAPDQLTPRAREIVDAARTLLEQEGSKALSMRRIAESLGIRAPSIYKHLPDKDALEAAIISAGRLVRPNRCPPSCGTEPTLLRSIRLASGSCLSVRRPN